MVEMKVEYLGELACRVVHGPSGVALTTDAPVDNMGKGSSFSPTDLVGTALATCILTIMGITAQRHDLDIKGTTIVVHKEMADKPLRRIARIGVDIHVPGSVSDENRKRLENAAEICPVKQSLHPDVKIDIRYTWGG